MPDSPTPFRISQLSIDPAWIDYNGHLNMAYYNVLFDRSLDEAGLELGLGPDYVASGFSWFTAEIHVRYLRELHADDRVTGIIRLIDADSKRLHWWQELWCETRGFLSATCETMTVHVDLGLRKASPFPQSMLDRITAWRERERDWPAPPGLGRTVGIRR